MSMSDMPMARHQRLVLAAVTSALSLMLVPAAGAQALRLTIAPATISFASADPDTTPSILAPAITVSYRVRFNPTGNWRISLLASGDLTAGTATIAINNVTWTASPTPPFQAGTLSRTVAQTLASGTGNVQNTTTGTVVFRLANSWTYNVGSYSTSVVFTLTAP
jgi:hypothetical protein